MKKTRVDLVLPMSLFLLILFFLVVGPFIQIWSVNTLFKTNIGYSWLNWFCVLILNSSVGAVSYRGK